MKKTGPGKITFYALSNLFKKPATTAYIGKGEPTVENRYRGRILYDRSTCINCHICMRDCPTSAITIINEGTKDDKKMRAILNVGKCIFCCQCVDSCPKSSLSCSQIIDLASTNKDDLTVEL